MASASIRSIFRERRKGDTIAAPVSKSLAGKPPASTTSTRPPGSSATAASALSDVEEGDAEYARAEALVDPPTGVDEQATEGERNDDERHTPRPEQPADQEAVEERQLDETRDRDV